MIFSSMFEDEAPLTDDEREYYHRLAKQRLFEDLQKDIQWAKENPELIGITTRKKEELRVWEADAPGRASREALVAAAYSVDNFKKACDYFLTGSPFEKLHSLT